MLRYLANLSFFQGMKCLKIVVVENHISSTVSSETFRYTQTGRETSCYFYIMIILSIQIFPLYRRVVSPTPICISENSRKRARKEVTNTAPVREKLSRLVKLYFFSDLKTFSQKVTTNKVLVCVLPENT